MKDSLLYKNYVAVAPRPDWPVLFDRKHDLLMQDYDWSADIATIQAPTSLMVGDRDALQTCHVVAFFELIGGQQVRYQLGFFRSWPQSSRSPTGRHALHHVRVAGASGRRDAVDVLDETHAVARSTMSELIRIRETGVTFSVVGTYSDHFVRSGGVWCFAKRTITPR